MKIRENVKERREQEGGGRARTRDGNKRSEVNGRWEEEVNKLMVTNGRK